MPDKNRLSSQNNQESNQPGSSKLKVKTNVSKQEDIKSENKIKKNTFVDSLMAKVNISPKKNLNSSLGYIEHTQGSPALLITSINPLEEQDIIDDADDAAEVIEKAQKIIDEQTFNLTLNEFNNIDLDTDNEKEESLNSSLSKNNEIEKTLIENHKCMRDCFEKFKASRYLKNLISENPDLSVFVDEYLNLYKLVIGCQIKKEFINLLNWVSNRKDHVIIQNNILELQMELTNQKSDIQNISSQLEKVNLLTNQVNEISLLRGKIDQLYVSLMKRS